MVGQRVFTNSFDPNIFIAGILSSYTGKEYSAVEVDCWATGDRVCRFRVEPEEKR